MITISLGFDLIKCMIRKTFAKWVLTIIFSSVVLKRKLELRQTGTTLRY